MPQPAKPKNSRPPIELDLGPGAAMRALVEEEKRKKRSRRRKRLVIALVAAIFLFYLGVTTFVFNPIEGTTIAFQNLAPRSSDFFVRMANLGDDLPPPQTSITPFQESATLWNALETGKLFLSAADVKSVTNAYRQAVAAFAETPLDPVRDLVGKEVALAGTFPEKGAIGASRFGLYLRVSWRVRAAMGLAKYAALRNWLLPPGTKVERLASGVLKVDDGAGGRDLYVARDRDLLLIASDEKWIQEAEQLGLERGEGSFGQSAIYADEIHSKLSARKGARTSVPSNLQLFVRVPSLRKAMGDTTVWPDAKSASIGERFLASCFTTALPEETAALVRFEKEPRRAIAIDTFTDLNSGVLDDFGKRLYAERPLQQQDFKRLAQMTPQSCFAFGMVALSGGAIARHLEAQLLPEERRAIDDAFRRTGKYDSLRAAIEDFSVAVGDRAVILARENVFPAAEKDPKNDGGPQAAVAIAFPQRSAEKVRQLRDFFKDNKQHFGIEETLRWPKAGYEMMEYTSPLVPGTGEVALLVANNWVFVCNQAKFLHKIMETWLLTARATDRPYEEDAGYQGLLAEHDQIANACAYVSGPKLAKALRPYVDWWVREASFGDPAQQRAEREALFQRVLAEKYPQYVGQNVPVNIRGEIDKVVDERMEQKMKSRATTTDAAARQRYLDALRLIEAVPAAFVSARFDPKHAALYARVDID